jgi:hypothetical protein
MPERAVFGYSVPGDLAVSPEAPKASFYIQGFDAAKRRKLGTGI